MQYYFINDLKKVGKKEDFISYIYDEEKGWIIDSENILMDRIIGYDGESIGSSSMLFKVDEITKEEAMHIINSGVNNA